MRLRCFGLLVPIAFLALAVFASPPSTGRGTPSPKVIAVRPRAKTPAPSLTTSKLAPLSVPHPTAMFLAAWSQDGGRDVSFKASAVGTRFFLEDRSGVSVYRFDGNGYVGELFLPKANLALAKRRFHMK